MVRHQGRSASRSRSPRKLPGRALSGRGNIGKGDGRSSGNHRSSLQHRDESNSKDRREHDHQHDSSRLHKHTRHSRHRSREKSRTPTRYHKRDTHKDIDESSTIDVSRGGRGTSRKDPATKAVHVPLQEHAAAPETSPSRYISDSKRKREPEQTQSLLPATQPNKLASKVHPAEEMAVEEEGPDLELEPNFALSGKLAADTNKVNGVVLLHSEPAEAANPQARWRLYQFKKGVPFQDPLPIHRQSMYLFGRERRVADIPTDHPSCSKQHAVLQYRRTEKEGSDGMLVSTVRPFVMDLGSVNGTFINSERIDSERYYELLEQDMIKFGNSTREYVLLREDMV